MRQIRFPGADRHSMDAICAAARDWILRLDEHPELEAECAAWRAADPAHERAWIEAVTVWEQAGALDALDRADWRAEIDALPGPSRSHLGGWAIAVAVILIAVVAILPNTGRADVEAKTHIGEIRTLRLADGSHITLGARSEVQFVPASRRVVLDHGQAFFDVVHDHGKPFTVIAGHAEIEVTDTKFDVRKMDGNVQISVLKGRVEIRRRGLLPLLTSASPARILTTGFKTELAPDASDFSPVEKVQYPPGAWRNGRLYYSEAPLSEIIADIERYSAVPIVITSPKIARMKVTTSFRVDQIQSFLANLVATLPVTKHRTADGTILLEARDSTT